MYHNKVTSIKEEYLTKHGPYERNTIQMPYLVGLEFGNYSGEYLISVVLMLKYCF